MLDTKGTFFQMYYNPLKKDLEESKHLFSALQSRLRQINSLIC